MSVQYSETVMANNTFKDVQIKPSKNGCENACCALFLVTLQSEKFNEHWHEFVFEFSLRELTSLFNELATVIRGV
jgi:hypothetical protein